MLISDPSNLKEAERKALAEIERLHRLLQWCEVRLPEQYRAGLRRMIQNPVEPDHAQIIQSKQS